MTELTCSKCKRVLPSERFEPRKKQCRDCRKQIRLEYHRKNPEAKARWSKTWNLKNKDKNKVYAARHREKVLAKRPPKQPCQQGHQIESLRWFKGKWTCRKCVSMQARKRSQPKKRIYDRKLQIKKWTEFYMPLYGPEVASKYQIWASSNLSQSARITREKLNRVCMPDEHKSCGPFTLIRITDMNYIAGLPPGNIGWKCRSCSLQSNDCGFFDIDHIHPRRKKGTGLKGNRQILCPNCHRIKTRKEHHEAISEKQAVAKGLPPTGVNSFKIPSRHPDGVGTGQPLEKQIPYHP